MGLTYTFSTGKIEEIASGKGEIFLSLSDLAKSIPIQAFIGVYQEKSASLLESVSNKFLKSHPHTNSHINLRKKEPITSLICVGYTNLNQAQALRCFSKYNIERVKFITYQELVAREFENKNLYDEIGQLNPDYTALQKIQTDQDRYNKSLRLYGLTQSEFSSIKVLEIFKRTAMNLDHIEKEIRGKLKWLE